MKYLIVILTALSLVNIADARQLSGDKIKTSKGDLLIHPIQHGTFAMEWNGMIIFNDPVGGEEKFKNLPDPDLILITDIHGDHLNLETLEVIVTSGATFIVPRAVADKMPDEYKDRLVILNNGKNTNFREINVEAIPMYNLPESPDSPHTKGRGNGYVLTLGGKRVYISGDTEDIKEMRELKNIDVAFVCMNLPYTMDVVQAASAVLEFKPAVVYPFHYRGQGGLADVNKFKKLVSVNPDIEVRLRKWYD